LSGQFDAGFSRIPSAEIALKDALLYQGDIQEHLRLLKANEKVIPVLITNPLIKNVSRPTLLHADLHKRNIFVSEDDPTIITSVIDWQSTSIEPAFVYAQETPDLIPMQPPPASVLLEAGQTPEEDPDQPPETAEEKKERERVEKGIWLCRQTFEVGMRGWVPHISAARYTDSTLLRPLRYCSTSWRDSASAIRQDLIELSLSWAKLGLPGVCPYQPSLEELNNHAIAYEQFDVKQKLKDHLMEIFQTDAEGWQPMETWELAKKLHKEAYESWIKEAREGGMENLDIEIAQKLWPWDHWENGTP
jgi:hypothetical protein